MWYMHTCRIICVTCKWSHDSEPSHRSDMVWVELMTVYSYSAAVPVGHYSLDKNVPSV